MWASLVFFACCVDRGHCDALITRPEESCCIRVCVCVCVAVCLCACELSRVLKMTRLMSDFGCSARGNSVVYIGWKKCMRGCAGKSEEKTQLGIPGHRFLGILQ